MKVGREREKKVARSYISLGCWRACERARATVLLRCRRQEGNQRQLFLSFYFYLYIYACCTAHRGPTASFSNSFPSFLIPPHVSQRESYWTSLLHTPPPWILPLFGWPIPFLRQLSVYLCDYLYASVLYEAQLLPIPFSLSFTSLHCPPFVLQKWFYRTPSRGPNL